MECLHWKRPRQRPIKIACIELCGAVYTAQRKRAMHISIGFCTHFIGICLGLRTAVAVGVGVGQCE